MTGGDATGGGRGLSAAMLWYKNVLRPELMGFVRFRQTPSRLQVSLVEERRVGGKVRHEHIASLGSILVPATIADRVAFWRLLHERLAKLSNRIGADEQGKILGAIHARIPMVTIDELRTLQRENAQADEKFWAGLQGTIIKAPD
jgi:hypothetical protein